ncbi:hypothetical protein FHETE_5359 [Fusarium heterosporum]|uniref:Uncharacterized protein n=1 Tax=Fusarium heterosporum TaxID=42747 RepID=A0A8H5TDV8_FUSHE|nr:hypothetical protein FHETE_5359 [Fusarium heterosporum]
MTVPSHTLTWVDILSCILVAFTIIPLIFIMIDWLRLSRKDTNTNTNDLESGMSIEMVSLGGRHQKAMLVEVIRIVEDGEEIYSKVAGQCLYDHPSFTPLDTLLGRQPAQTRPAQTQVHEDFNPSPRTKEELLVEMVEGMRYLGRNYRQ